MRILLLDDEELQLIRLEKEVRKVVSEDDEIFSYQNSLKALDEMKEKNLDIAFLDIEMPGMDGIHVAKKLQKRNPLINIIFVTAYNQYALDAHQMHASGYLTKPVNAADIKHELEELRHPYVFKGKHKIQVKCFGNFEVFYQGEPLRFSYSKSKEVFAYLVDREGSSVKINELNAVLWEEDHPSYLRNLIADIQFTLKAVGCSDVFIKRHSECSIDISKIDCDAYEYKKNNPNAVHLYRGEYMSQYSWANFEQDLYLE